MAPKKEKTEFLDLDSIDPGIISSITFRPQFFKDAPFGIREKEKQHRINTFHYVIHTLAFMIVIPFLFMVFLGMKVPVEYSTIVSIIIGFYFGKSLLDR